MIFIRGPLVNVPTVLTAENETQFKLLALVSFYLILSSLAPQKICGNEGHYLHRESGRAGEGQLPGFNSSPFIFISLPAFHVIVCSLFFQYGPANFSNIGSPIFPLWFHENHTPQVSPYWNYGRANISNIVSQKPHTKTTPIMEIWASPYWKYGQAKISNMVSPKPHTTGEPISEIWVSQYFQSGWAHISNLGSHFFAICVCEQTTVCYQTIFQKFH